MPATEKIFSEIAGVPICYARPPVAPYGTSGVQMNFFCTNDFFDLLTGFVEELILVCPLGKPEAIVTAGVYVDKPNSYHRYGRAFDLDSIFWTDRNFVTNNYLNDKPFYLGVEAILRSHFGLVLQYSYDRRHEDHFHVDNSRSVDFKKSSKSSTLFLQASLNVLFDEQLDEDGIWGSDTAASVKRVFASLDIEEPVTTIANWKQFLDECKTRAFHFETQAFTPALMLAKVYETINSANIDELEAKRIESSLTAFAMLPKTRQFLESA